MQGHTSTEHVVQQSAMLVLTHLVIFLSFFLFVLSVKAWGLGEAIFSHVETYFIILGIPCFLFGNLSFLNAGLRDFDALQVVPIYQTCKK